MEKRTPHYSLRRVQELVAAGMFRVTATALRDADRDFGLDTAEQIAPYVLALSAQHFYKSMTAYSDHRIWQDVYHVLVASRAAYVKVQITADEAELTVVISFKQRDDWYAREEVD